MRSHGVIAAGYNPKDQPEMFVRKILNNQKRMKNTIAQYVKEHELGDEIKIAPAQNEEAQADNLKQQIETNLKTEPQQAEVLKVRAEGNLESRLFMDKTQLAMAKAAA